MKNFFGEAVDWMGGALDDVGDIVGDISEFVAGLPNELVGLADRIAKGQADATRGARREATEFRMRQLFGEFGPLLLIGGITAVGVVLLSR